MVRVTGALGAAAILLGVLIAWSASARAAPAMPSSTEVQAALRGDNALVLGGRVLDRAALASLYAARNFTPLWSEQRAASFRLALEEAPSHGIEPAAFAVAEQAPVARELLLTDSFLRYASALTRGRVLPAVIEPDWRIASPDFDAAKTLDAAVATDIAVVLAALAPQDPAYERLRAALQRYRDLAKAPWRPLPISPPLKPGDSGERVRLLRERLALEGFGDAASASDPAAYDASLAAEVGRFQAARGLAADGAAGRATLAALNVSSAWRVRQIRLNLERRRSLPRVSAAARIEVNVAAASAVLYEDGWPAKAMRAIVGAIVHPTPVLRARLVSVLLNPPWNVPSSIIKNEIGPALKRDPHYLERGGYVYAEVEGGHQLVQLPGPKNALGALKFEMPNPDDIYMHDTPDRALFARAQRTISHGCVRLEDPRDLARLVLNDDNWSRDALDAAIATGKTQRVMLRQSIPVYVLYWTAFVDEDGTVEFRDDIYGRDQRLEDALTVQDAMERVAVAPGGRGRS